MFLAKLTGVILILAGLALISVVVVFIVSKWKPKRKYE